MDESLAYYTNNSTKYSKLDNKPDFKIIDISNFELGVDIWLIELKLIDKRLIPTFKGSIFRDGLLNRLNKMGYFKIDTGSGSYTFVKKTGCFLKKVQISEMKDDFFVNHIDSLTTLHVNYYGSILLVRPEKLKESYLNQFHLFFNNNYLEFLPTLENKFIRDSREKSFFYFNNCMVAVQENKISTISYEDLNSRNYCIWEEQIIQHDFKQEPNTKSHFENFIKNICNQEIQRIKSAESAIGYLLNTYSEPNKGQVIILYDEALTKSGIPQGGTGKGLFANAIKQLRNTAKIDGKKIDTNDRFKWQSITIQTEIVQLDDVGENFSFETLYSCTNEGWNIEAKYAPEIYISPENSPKIIITSNRILENRGSTNRRRQFILEFSDHYSKHLINGTEQPIIEEHGCVFFDSNDWDDNEWNSFYLYMLKCNQLYLKEGLIPYRHINVQKSLLIQETSEIFVQWIKTKTFKINTWYDNDSLYNEFITFSELEKESFSKRKFSNNINLMADRYNWSIKRKRSNNRSKFKLQSLQVS